MMFAIRDDYGVASMFAYRSKRSRRLEANDGRYFLESDEFTSALDRLGQLLLRNKTRINIGRGQNG